MIGLGLAVLLFVAIGVILIVRRKELALGMAMLSGASTPPGCAVAVGILFFLLAIVTVVLHQMGLFTRP